MIYNNFATTRAPFRFVFIVSHNDELYVTQEIIYKQGFYILVPDEGPRSQLPTINRIMKIFAKECKVSN